MTESKASAPTAQSEDELAFAGFEAQALMLIGGEVSSQELTELCLRRIAASQPTLNAFRVLCEEAALEEAAAADERLASGDGAPLLGVPVAIKDDVDLAGHATPFGCGGEHRTATEDAEVVRRLRDAGAIVIGKTNAPEVGQWPFTESPAFGATPNPWSTGHTPGGSSGGAAAAVAAGLVAGAIGSDGAGSVRIPAAWTGLVGLKPQRGRISTWPDPEAFNGLTCFGPLTRSVADAALLLDAVGGNREGDLHRPPPHSESFAAAASQAPRRLRVALSFATPFGVPDEIDPEVRAATERTAERLAELGHDVVRTRRIGRIFERVDVILTPTTAVSPPRIGAMDGRGYWATSTAASAACPFAWAWNVVGWPGISVPAGFTAAGLPIGAQLLGRENDEATLLALAGQLEAAADGEWTERRPEIPKSH